MRKSITLLLLLFVFIGCKPKQQVVNEKLDYKSGSMLKGSWSISSVTFPGSDYIKIVSFDLADSKCLVGSNWSFIPNNNKGEMALDNASCTSFSSPITWYVNKEGQFVMKILNETKSKKVTEGFVLNFANQSENSFQLVDKVNVGGKLVDVVYQFQKK
jgi:hypothetical protein